MKAVKYIVLLLVMAASFNSCVVRRAGWVPGHYEPGPYGHRHWVRGHYA